MPADLALILQTLRLHLLSLSITAPYYQARLLRIIEQLEYVVGTWPSEHWPFSPYPAHQLVRHVRRNVPARL